MDTYEIYDTDSANLVRSFPTLAAALEMVQRVVNQSGEAAVASWELGRVDPTGDMLAGKDLVARAMTFPKHGGKSGGA